MKTNEAVIDTAQVDTAQGQGSSARHELFEPGRRLSAGLLLAAAALGGVVSVTACGPPESHDRPYTYETRLAGEVTDPLLRAETVTALKDGEKVGSASLIRRGDQISVVTVEHVARPLSGMPSTVVEKTNGMVLGDQTPKKGDVRFYVPSVGLLPTDSEPIFVGDDKDASGNPVDRVAIYELSDEQQKMLAGAEAAGSLKIPVASAYKPEFGDELSLAAPDLGKPVKLIYLVGSGGEHTTIPLAILDEGMDVRKGIANLKQQERAEIAKDTQAAVKSATDRLRQLGMPVEGKTDQELIDDAGVTGYWTQRLSKAQSLIYAASSLQTKFANKYDDSKVDPKLGGQAVADKVACHGDSGGVLVDRQGAVMGVLSNGEQLATSGDQIITLTRMGNPSSCLGMVGFRTVTPGQ